MPVEHYRMYIDECGTDDVVNTHNPMHRHLGLTGVIASVRYMRETGVPELEAFKRRHFRDHDPDGPPLVLHRADFLSAKGPYRNLSDPDRREAFTNDACEMLWSLDHCVVTVVLDKHAMLLKRHWKNKEPYHYCAEVLGEKFVQYLERMDGHGDIFAESRQQKKNKALNDAFQGVYSTGTRFVSSERFARRLTTPEIKFRDKRDNVAGLQLADIYAKPSLDRIMLNRDRTYALKDFSKRIASVLVHKTYDRDRTGYVDGYGMKYIP